MSTMFRVGSVVVATAGCQGMREGERFEVVGTSTLGSLLGGVVDYALCSLEDKRYLTVRNGHLVLTEPPAPKTLVEAEIAYTVDTRRGRHEITTRKTKTVRASREKLGAAVERAVAKLRDVGAYSINVRWPAAVQ